MKNLIDNEAVRFGLERTSYDLFFFSCLARRLFLNGCLDY
jgi:hypothetical protein